MDVFSTATAKLIHILKTQDSDMIVKVNAILGGILIISGRISLVAVTSLSGWQLLI